MTKISVLLVWALISLVKTCPHHLDESYGTFLISYDSLIKNKALINENDDFLVKAQEILLQKADEILEGEPYSVTYKEKIPEGATIHDYVSLAPYMWPDPTKEDGLPFIQKDGKRNPFVTTFRDAKMLNGVSNDVQILGLAYFFSEDEKYAKRAQYLLEVFFMDNSTKMNPNFDFSQLVMGKKASGGNIIGANALLKVIDGIQLIKMSDSWTTKDQREMESWFKSFLDWMRNSRKGKVEARRQNNIATFYTIQATTFSLFINNRDLAKEIIESRAYKNIKEQIAKDGSMPRELKRAQPWNYVSYNLGAFHDLIKVGRHVDIDLWEYSTENSGSIRQAYDWVESYNSNSDRNSFNFHGQFIEKNNIRRFITNNPRPDNRKGQRNLSDIRAKYGVNGEVTRDNYINILTK
ncbi:MAG: alginate lyase family protein [Anditalea sp.]